MVSIGFHFGAKTSRYGPHELGYRRATRAKQSDAIPSLPSSRCCRSLAPQYAGSTLLLPIPVGGGVPSKREAESGTHWAEREIRWS